MPHYLTKIINCLYPCYCLLCNQRSTADALICQPCLHSLPWQPSSCLSCAHALEYAEQSFCGHCLHQPPPFQSTFAPLAYEGDVIKLVCQFKFKRQLTPGRALAQLLLAQIIKQNIQQPQCLIPVPLHRKRLRQRGFNQALEIARFLGNKLNIPVLPYACSRVRNTKAQSSLAATERATNLKDAFEINTKLPYSHIALIDDVMTTGHTVSTLAQTWRDSGVQHVDVWCTSRAVQKF